ncbi:G-protein coupled receptor family C group 6 member A-like [Poecilia formosa]|uniref:G-protein coupled receptor family C group 6 member A n=1 Tax=Poecilia formosa TaxID=48698 RepID=A0A087XV24_POEFO|nr:PREDICTED: G-protein coupled receptor family C group 6 member A-like [Poecilia formosa]
MEQFFKFWFFLAIFSLQVFCSEALQEAKSPGDIIIGGLFPIHESVDDNGLCNRFSVARLAQSLMMVRAIEEINQSGELGNITLGYHIVDSCGDITTALRNTLPFMKINDREQHLTPPVMAVIGDYYSEISVAVTRQLNLEKIPEISYGSTSGLLSDKTRFPSFLRTVPEDDHQAKAVIEILKDHNWNWVGIVATDGEYGRYAVERLRHHAERHDICFAYIKFLPEFLVDNNLKDSINEAVKSITENTNVSVIVSFTKPNHMMYIFDNVLKHHSGRNKVWIASDTWSQSVNCLDTTRWNLKDVGTIFGITLKSGNTSRFEQFLRNLDNRPDLYQNNSFLSDFLNGTVSGSNTSLDTKITQLINMIYPYAVFSIELAVKAIAETVKDLCINQECDIATLQPEKFRDVLKTANFYLDGKKYSFDKKSNLNSGYDIVLWRYNSPNTLDMNYEVGHYHIEQGSITFIRSEISNLYHQTKKVRSRCSTCYPGEWKVRKAGQPICCYECKKCPVNYYSADKDASLCLACENTTHYSFEGSQNCTKKRIDYLEWDDVYHIVLLAFAALGVLLTLVVAVIFLARWNTPVVRSSVGPIAILLLLSLLSTFGSVVFFGGQPKDWQCQTRQVLFGLSFTLSVSCILVRSFRIIMAFEFDPVTQGILEKLYKPYLIIPLCMAGQVLICTVWLAYRPPVFQQDSKSFVKLLLLKCHENLLPAFGAMLAYIGFLAIICFILAFKGRKLPECYNESKFITFSMLIYIITWIIFGPVYVNVTGKYNSAIEMAVILISAYSVLFCLFFTKCYIILFKAEENTVNVFRNTVRNFSMGKDRNLDKNYPSGIQNSALSMESLSSPEPLHPVAKRRESINSVAKPFFQSPVLDKQPPLLQDEAQ